MSVRRSAPDGVVACPWWYRCISKKGGYTFGSPEVSTGSPEQNVARL